MAGAGSSLEKAGLALCFLYSIENEKKVQAENEKNMGLIDNGYPFGNSGQKRDISGQILSKAIEKIYNKFSNIRSWISGFYDRLKINVKESMFHVYGFPAVQKTYVSHSGGQYVHLAASSRSHGHDG